MCATCPTHPIRLDVITLKKQDIRWNLLTRLLLQMFSPIQFYLFCPGLKYSVWHSVSNHRLTDTGLYIPEFKSPEPHDTRQHGGRLMAVTPQDGSSKQRHTNTG
jgi:hypothetical protein